LRTGASVDTNKIKNSENSCSFVDKKSFGSGLPGLGSDTMKNFVTSVYQRLWLTMILTIIIAGFGVVADAAAQSNDAPQITVIAAVVGAREGPGVTYPVITYLLQNQQVTATGYDAASNWWQVTLPDGKTGWVSGQSYYVSVTGDTSSLVKPEVSPVTDT
jgi:hypothetical protein